MPCATVPGNSGHITVVWYEKVLIVPYSQCQQSIINKKPVDGNGVHRLSMELKKTSQGDGNGRNGYVPLRKVNKVSTMKKNIAGT